MRRVLILSLGRSGSSFVGDIFDNHKNVVYYFEPMHTAKRILERGFKAENESNAKAAEVFDEYFSCSFTKKDYMFIQRFFFSTDRLRTVALTKPPFCKIGATRKFCKHKQVNRTSLYNVCMTKYTHTVIKELHPRIPYGLRGFLNHMSAPVKVVHLIRDPRAIFMSWKSSGWFHKVAEEVVHERISSRCRIVMETAQYGVKNLQNDGLYKIIRYEDICLNFNSESKKLLDFAGLPLYSEFESYLEKVENFDNLTTAERRDTYSTKRRLKDQIDKWRARIDIPFLLFIENACKDMMVYFRYSFVGNDEKLLRNRTIPLVM